mgnify:FL=1
MVNYYDEIKEKLSKNEIYATVKDYSKERNKVLTYYEVGKFLSEAGKEYGSDILGQYADKLAIEVGKKYNRRTLYNMRKFYEIFNSEKLYPFGSILLSSHYREFLSLKNIDEIKEKLLKNEIYAKVKDYSKERNKVLTYFEVGKLLSEAGKKYGNDVIGSYAEKLVNEVGKKYNRRTLYRMKQFYNLFGEQKVSTMWTQLTWSHIRELLPLKDENAIGYYLNSAINLSLTQRELSEKIKSKEYERLGEETKNKLITNEELKLPDLVPNPILIKSEFNIEQLTEYALKQSILNNLDNFLTQLGNGFLYAGNEYKMKAGNNYNYIDLLLYNVKFKCFVVIELKVTELKKEHIGQIEVYMNYIDKNVKDISDDKTIGIIICAKNNQFIIEYCSDERIFAREFKITS